MPADPSPSAPDPSPSAPSGVASTPSPSAPEAPPASPAVSGGPRPTPTAFQRFEGLLLSLPRALAGLIEDHSGAIIEDLALMLTAEGHPEAAVLLREAWATYATERAAHGRPLYQGGPG